MISAIGSLVVAVACVIAGWLSPMLIQNVSADLRVALVVGITMGILGTILVVVGQLGKRSLPTNGDIRVRMRDNNITGPIGHPHE